jgi:hypothetical protein
MGGRHLRGGAMTDELDEIPTAETTWVRHRPTGMIQAVGDVWLEEHEGDDDYEELELAQPGERVELFERDDGRFDWRRVADGGATVTASGGQGFSRLAAARRSAVSRNEGVPVVDARGEA